jgi:restriction system protein
MVKLAELPTYEHFMLPVLKTFFEIPQPIERKELYAKLLGKMPYTDEELILYVDKNNTLQQKLIGRMGWAITYLFKAGCIERLSRSVYKITSRGQSLVKADKPITKKTLEVYPEFLGFISRENGLETDDCKLENDDLPTSALSPDEELKNAYAIIRKSIQTELLDTLKTIDPAQFEYVVLDVLVKMGYGGGKKQWATVTRYNNDGGIDGLIKEDPLGLDMIYVQAKRYRDSAIGVPALQSFYGALAEYNPCKGVFITTSTFTDKARQYAKQQRIRLIDGDELSELMLDHEVGVQPIDRLVLHRIDNDYFEALGV